MGPGSKPGRVLHSHVPILSRQRVSQHAGFNHHKPDVRGVCRACVHVLSASDHLTAACWVNVVFPIPLVGRLVSLQHASLHSHIFHLPPGVCAMDKPVNLR